MTIESLLKPASFNFSEALHEYFSPTCGCCFAKGIYHAARSCATALVIDKTGELLSGEEFEHEFKTYYPELFNRYLSVLDARKNWKNLDQRLLDKKEINGYKGKIILDCESIVREAYKILNIELPSLKDLIEELNENYKLKNIHSIFQYKKAGQLKK